MNKFLLTTAAVLFSTLSLNAQSTSTENSDFIYFEFAAIDFNQYSKLHESVKSDGNFLIETVCIPAKVICIKKISANASMDSFERLALKSGLIATPWLEQNQPRAFEDRCISARTRN
jgi:hypothetical protein